VREREGLVLAGVTIQKIEPGDVCEIRGYETPLSMCPWVTSVCVSVQALGTKGYASESKARVLRPAGLWEDSLFTSDKE
jgi:hypothetical protein